MIKLKKEIRKIITEELVKDISGESTDIYSLVFQSFKAENIGVKRANERTVEVIEDLKDRLMDRLNELN